MVKKIKKFFAFRRSHETEEGSPLTEKELMVRVEEGTTRAVREYGPAFKKLAEYDRS